MSSPPNLFRFALIAAVACTVSLACSSPPQSGTNTNWVCRVDADCTEHVGTMCQDGLCKSGSRLVDSGSGSHPGDSAVGVGCPNGVCPLPESGGVTTAGPDGSSIDGQLNAIAATDTGWVAVGSYKDSSTSGRALVVTMDTTWKIVDVPGEQGSLSDVAFGNGTIVAVGPSIRIGQILVKPPGAAWQYQPQGANIYQVLFGNGLFFVGSGVEPGSKFSSNGIDWTGTAGALWTAFVDAYFVQFNAYDVPGGAMAGFRTSTDFATWTDPIQPTDSYTPQALALVGNQLFGIVEDPCTSTPCAHDVHSQVLGPRTAHPSELTKSPLPWSGQYTSTPSIATDGMHVVACVAGELHVTTLPIGSTEWTTHSNIPAWEFYDVAYSKGSFAAVGQAQGRPLVATSTDGSSWTPVSFIHTPIH